MKKQIRIKDIADKAGVSTGTVDRVLHDRGRVAPEVKKRVMEVVDELGYERNPLASALAYNKVLRVAALLPDPTIDAYWKQTDDGVQRAARSVKHYGLLVEPFHFNQFDPKGFVKKAKEALKKNPDGLLFPPMFSNEAKWLLGECQKRGIPHVIINTKMEGGAPLCYVGQDSYQSGVLGARLLNFGLNDGHTACILNLDFGTTTAHHLLDKERGFRDYFSDIGNKRIEIIRKDFEDFNNEHLLRLFLKKLMTEHPSLNGIFITNSRAHKVIDCLEGMTDRPIKIVGFDLVEANLRYLYANKINFLINQNPIDQGFLGVTNLFKHLILKEAVEADQYLPLDIVVKENVEYYVRKQLSFEMAV